MEPFDDDRLAAALESLRPTPRPDFTAELDRRAAAGFPRRSPLGQLAERLQAIKPRRVLIPAGATALAAIAAVTAVVAVGTDDLDHSPRTQLDSLPPSAPATGDSAPGEPARGSGAADGSETQYSTEMPGVSGAAASGEASSSESFGRSSTGPYASQTPRREIERSAEIALGTDPEKVRRAAAEVFATVHTYRGIVLDSSIRDGAAGDAGARYTLLIPSAKLGDAMADFSAIAEVRSRHEATADITAPTVRTGELLRESRARIDGLLAQLAAADTEAERTATEAELRSERRRVAYLRTQLSSLERRANFSRVSLRIETGEAATPSGESSGWGVGDALRDAGEILAIAAAVTIVALAILGPIALLALLGWLAHRAHVRRARRRALA